MLCAVLCSVCCAWCYAVCARYSPVSLCMMRSGSLGRMVAPTDASGGLGCIIMHFYEIYLRMHLARAWQLTACSSVPRDACLDVSSSGRDVVPWGTATPGGGILKFRSGVVRTRWDSHGLEAQFVDRGFYLCCQVNSTGRHVFSHDGLFDDSQPES